MISQYCEIVMVLQYYLSEKQNCLFSSGPYFFTSIKWYQREVIGSLDFLVCTVVTVLTDLPHQKKFLEIYKLNELEI